MRPEFIEAIDNKKTSLGNNKALPDDVNSSFLYDIVNNSYLDIIKELEAFNLDGKNPYEILAELIKKCKEIETPYRNQLERLCVDFVVKYFDVPEESVDIISTLTDSTDLGRDSINLDPSYSDNVDGDVLNEEGDVQMEVDKRRLLDVLAMGAGMTVSFDSIDDYAIDIDESLPKLYRAIILLNSYLLFQKEDIGMTDANKMQMGTVEVSLGGNDSKVRIEAQGEIVPILISELIRGFVELFFSHGLPKSKSMALTVLGQADYLKAEPWDMRLGPGLWKTFIDSTVDIDSKALPYLLRRVASLDIEKFNYLFKKIFSKSSKAEEIMKFISDKAKDDAERNEFVKRMKAKSGDNGIMADNFFKPQDF